MNTTRCQLPSSGPGDHCVGPTSSNTDHPFQPLMALHNPGRIHATVSRDAKADQRVGVPDEPQTSSTIHDARVGDRHPPGEDSNRPRTSSSTTSKRTLPHNRTHRPYSNSIEASRAVSVASRSDGAHPSNAPRGQHHSPPPSASGLQSRTVHSGTSQNGADNTQSSSTIQPSVIVSIATRLNSDIVRLSPPLQAMANYLLRLMGARKEESLRRLEMHIPYLWVYMPPLLLWLRIFLGSRSDQRLDVGGSGAGNFQAPPKDEAGRRDHEGEIVGTHAYAPRRKATQHNMDRQGDELREKNFVYVNTPENCEGPENTPSPSFSSVRARPHAAQQAQSHGSYESPGGQIVQAPHQSQLPHQAHPQRLLPTGVNADQGSITSRNASMRTSDSIDNGPSSNAQDYIRHSSLLTDDERQAGRNTPVIIQLEERLPDPLTVEDAQDRIRITGWAYEQEPTPGSSSGASRKRGSDQIDDDGVGASSASASRPKRPRRNNAKGLKPSASSSRTGTTAGASDLPTNK